MIKGLTLPVLRGSAWSFGGQAATLAASLVATPIVISRLGVESYGVLMLITVLVGYAGASDLGMGEASTRFGAGRHAVGDDTGEASVVWTALTVLLTPATLVALLFMLAAAPIIDLFATLPASLRADATLALRIAGAGFAARALASVVNTPQLVRLRIDLVTLINTTASIGQILLVPVVLWFGGRLAAAAAVGAVCAAVAMVAHAVVALRLLPELARPRLARELIRPLLGYGAATTVIVLAGLVTLNGEKLVVAKVLSATALAYYSVAFTLARLMALAPGAIGQSLLPAFSRLQADADRPALQALYDRTLRLLLAVSVPAAVLLCLIARPFLTAWAGPDFGRESALPLYILTVGTLVDGLSYVPRAFLNARNRPDLAARLHLIDVVPYLLLAMFLTGRYGAAGAAAAWTVRATFDCLVVLFLAGRNAGKDAVPATVVPFVPAFLALAVPCVLLLLLQPSPLVAMTVTAGALAAYGALMWTRVLTGEERAWADAFLRTRRLGR